MKFTYNGKVVILTLEQIVNMSSEPTVTDRIDINDTEQSEAIFDIIMSDRQFNFREVIEIANLSAEAFAACCEVGTAV